MLTNNQATHSASIMYAMNAIVYVAIAYVFIDGINSEGLVESVMEAWEYQESKEILMLIVQVVSVNLVMCVLVLLSKRWIGVKFIALLAISWFLVALGAFWFNQAILVFTYFWAAVCFSIRAFNQRKGRNRA